MAATAHEVSGLPPREWRYPLISCAFGAKTSSDHRLSVRIVRGGLAADVTASRHGWARIDP